MLIKEASPTGRPGVFARIERARCTELVAEAFIHLVTDSFETHPMRAVTEDEVKRRTDLLQRWLRKLCDGMNYPVNRALYTLRAALRAELDGVKFEPPSVADQTLVRVDDGIEPFAAQIRRRMKQFDLAQ